MSKILMPLADGFEDSEFSVPYQRLKEAGHQVLLVGAQPGKEVTGKQGRVTATLQATAAGLSPEDFDAVVIPGGQSPDRLRTDAALVDFIARFHRTGRPLAAICHGPLLLIEADVVRDRTLTSWPSVQKDLENAGACWEDRPVLEDGNLITSRKPEDLDAFTAAVERRLAANVSGH